MSEEIRDLLEKSAQSRDAALLLLKDDYVDFAASRAYYAMFYAFDVRNAGDYGSMHAVSEEKARQIILEAGELLEAIQHVILQD